MGKARLSALARTLVVAELLCGVGAVNQLESSVKLAFSVKSLNPDDATTVLLSIYPGHSAIVLVRYLKEKTLVSASSVAVCVLRSFTPISVPMFAYATF